MPLSRSTKIRLPVTTSSKSRSSARIFAIPSRHFSGKAGDQVVLHAADSDVVRGDARAAQHLLEVPGQLARLDAVEEGRHRRQLEAGRPAARQVVAHPRELAAQRAQPLAALGQLEPEQLLDREHVAEVGEDRGVVVQPIGVGDRLIPGAALALLLEAAVQVADLDVEVDDVLAVQFDQELHRAMGGRVRRAHVEQLVLDVEVALEVVVEQRAWARGPAAGVASPSR